MPFLAADESIRSEYGSQECVHSYTRFPSHRRVIQGSYVAPASGMVELRWDNSYSRLRGKKLYYRVAAVSAAEAAAAAGNEEAERAKLRQVCFSDFAILELRPSPQHVHSV